MAEELLNDIGHGKNTYPPSKGVPGMAEFEFNNAVGMETQRLLSGKVTTFEAQPFNGVDVPLRTRTNLYDQRWLQNKKAIGISNHSNANGDPNRRGFGVFYWHTSTEAKKLAEIILDEYKKEFPDRGKYPIWGSGLFPSVPGTWTDLHMCRETKAVFVLVEWEFMTNPVSLGLLKSTEYRQRCALVNARSVCRWYGIKYEEKEVFKLAERDVNKVSSWAESSWNEMKANGYIDGTRPGDNSTREENAVIMNRLRKNILKLVAEISAGEVKNAADITSLDARLQQIEKDDQ